MKDLNKYRGCLIGGAVGDALGYAVEFSGIDLIVRRYGAQGITEYDHVEGEALISDDTQMTLFTANGLLLGTTRGMTRGVMGTYPEYIAACYRDWLRTQGLQPGIKDDAPSSWLMNIPNLFARRAPGNTCLSALESGVIGTVENPINNSKGCGGIMRVAPIGLYFDGKNITPEEIDLLGAEVAAITHGHELGYIPAAALVHIIHLLSHDNNVTLLEAVEASMAMMKKLFPQAKHLAPLLELMQRAIDLAAKALDDVSAIQQLGEGWVAEETLAIASYCALKYQNDFEKAIIAAVNHSGDSDSTGAVTGNILGAYLGLSAIPEKYTDKLELKDVILEIADDLYHDCQLTEYGTYQDEIWVKKYIEKSYYK